jgi:hypothetical protein
LKEIRLQAKEKLCPKGHFPCCLGIQHHEQGRWRLGLKAARTIPFPSDPVSSVALQVLGKEEGRRVTGKVRFFISLFLFVLFLLNENLSLPTHTLLIFNTISQYDG